MADIKKNSQILSKKESHRSILTIIKSSFLQKQREMPSYEQEILK